MPEEPVSNTPTKDPAPIKVLTIRDWKEYVGESLLIIFSVLLALALTEWFNKLHEKSETHELLENVRSELVRDKIAESNQYAYQKSVLARIDSALHNKEVLTRIVMDNEFHHERIFPDGVMHGGDLSTVAWEIAKEHNISSRIGFPLMSRLTDLYENQARILKLEEKIGSVVLDRESRNPANAAVTLTLIRDNYRAWAFDRAPGLLMQYDEAIKAIDELK